VRFIGAFGTTGHDRGHLAPNQSFSWHICGAYKTFTMANMAPQLAALNRGLWAKLEEQVLFWAVTEGPIQVATGTLFTTFPAGKFNVIRDVIVDRQTIVRTGQRLKPRASGLPGKVVKPTGFYKVIFRPGRDGEEDRAIAFLVPHTRTAMNGVFQQFVARIDVVESVTGFAFAVPEVLRVPAARPGGWSARSRRDGGFVPRPPAATVRAKGGSPSCRETSGLPSARQAIRTTFSSWDERRLRRILIRRFTYYHPARTHSPLEKVAL
jgi:hypothetical protein